MKDGVFEEVRRTQTSFSAPVLRDQLQNFPLTGPKTDFHVHPDLRPPLKLGKVALQNVHEGGDWSEPCDPS